MHSRRPLVGVGGAQGLEDHVDLSLDVRDTASVGAILLRHPGIESQQWSEAQRYYTQNRVLAVLDELARIHDSNG